MGREDLESNDEAAAAAIERENAWPDDEYMEARDR